MSATTNATTTSARGLRFTENTPFTILEPTPVLQGKTVQERKPIRNQGKAAQHQQHSERDQQGTRGYFQRVHVRAEAAVKLQKALHQKRRQQKRHSQSKRIYREQQDPLDQRILFSGDGEDRGQDRDRTRRPAEGKRKTDHERANRSTASFHAM